MIDHVWLEHFMIRLPSPLVLSNMPKTRLTWEWFIFTLRRLGLFILWSNKSWISVMVIINSNLFFFVYNFQKMPQFCPFLTTRPKTSFQLGISYFYIEKCIRFFIERNEIKKRQNGFKSVHFEYRKIKTNFC